jgi:hypothetical protein
MISSKATIVELRKATRMGRYDVYDAPLNGRALGSMRRRDVAVIDVAKAIPRERPLPEKGKIK